MKSSFPVLENLAAWTQMAGFWASVEELMEEGTWRIRGVCRLGLLQCRVVEEFGSVCFFEEMRTVEE